MSDDVEPQEREFEVGDSRWRVAWIPREGSFDMEVRPAVIPEWNESMRGDNTSYDPEPFEAGDLEDSYWQTVPPMARSVDVLDSLIDGGLTPELRAQLRGDVAAHALDEDAWTPWSEPIQAAEALFQARLDGGGLVALKITSVSDLLDRLDTGPFDAAAYDRDALRDELCSEVQRRIPEGTTLLDNGDVIVELSFADHDVALTVDDIWARIGDEREVLEYWTAEAVDEIDWQTTFDRHRLNPDVTPALVGEYDRDIDLADVPALEDEMRGHIARMWATTENRYEHDQSYDSDSFKPYSSTVRYLLDDGRQVDRTLSVNAAQPLTGDPDVASVRFVDPADRAASLRADQDGDGAAGWAEITVHTERSWSGPGEPYLLTAKQRGEDPAVERAAHLAWVATQPEVPFPAGDYEVPTSPPAISTPFADREDQTMPNQTPAFNEQDPEDRFAATLNTGTVPAPRAVSAAERARAASEQNFPMSARMSIQEAAASRAASPAALSAVQIAAFSGAQSTQPSRSRNFGAEH